MESVRSFTIEFPTRKSPDLVMFKIKKKRMCNYYDDRSFDAFAIITRGTTMLSKAIQIFLIEILDVWKN